MIATILVSSFFIVVGLFILAAKTPLYVFRTVKGIYKIISKL